MTAFRYKAIENNGASVSGEIEAEDRKGALHLLSERGLFPSSLVEAMSAVEPAVSSEAAKGPAGARFRLSSRIKRKEITSFTREMASLLQAAIPIPQALDGLSEQGDNRALGAVVRKLSVAVRTGASFSAALEEHPRLFNKLYVNMVRVGEEAGQLQRVMADLAALLEHEDEVRGEVVTAVAYPCFVLAFGVFTVAILLTFVLPRLTGMLEEMLDDLPWPTRVLMGFSGYLQSHWWWIVPTGMALVLGLRWLLRSPRGALAWDGLKLRLPAIGGVFWAAALGRFSRTLGTMLRSGVSLLPALKIVEHTIGNLVLAGLISRVTEETRGGDSLAAPLGKLGIYPRTVIQMIHVGEETGKLDEMLLRVADIQERRMRAHTKTVISLLAPALILVVGALVGFMVIALLLPIFKMSQIVR